MATYGDMQTRIADELARSDLTSQIKLAIQSAIAHYTRSRFYFNEAILQFTTVVGQEYYYTGVSQLNQIDTLRITVDGGSTYVLDAVSNNYIESVSQNPQLVGDPIMWSWFAQQVRLYPIPYKARVISINNSGQLTSLVNAGDTNAWMNDGEELIRARAKADLFSNVIRDFAEAQVMRSLEKDAEIALIADTEQRSMQGGLLPTRF